MKDLCIPIPNFNDCDYAEIELRVGDKKEIYDFRIEPIFWDIEDEFSQTDDEALLSPSKIDQLKKAIHEYDKNWELIQIYSPSKVSKTIQVLYRKKSKING